MWAAHLDKPGALTLVAENSTRIVGACAVDGPAHAGTVDNEASDDWISDHGSPAAADEAEIRLCTSTRPSGVPAPVMPC